MTAVQWMDAPTLRAAVGRGELSCEEVARVHLDRAGAQGRRLNAILTLTDEHALADARRWDSARARGERLPPLAGVPVVLKDNLCTKGVRTTCGSRMLQGYVPPYDATVVERLRAAGAVIVGKANMDEFAMGSSTENSAFGPAKNPWRTTHVPGGSSGGCAAAVAAGLATLALGSDTGGSVKQPAALCGVVGLRPTYGRVSRYGLVAFASSLDQVGPMTRTVMDNLLLLSAISGSDGRDSTCAPRAPSSAEPPEPGAAGLRVGIARDQVDSAEPEVAQAVLACGERLREAGASVRDVSLRNAQCALATYYVLAVAEASSNLARYDGVRYGLRVPGRNLEEQYEATRAAGFGAEAKRRILLGTYVLSAGYYDAYYARAQRARALVRRDFEEAFEQVDVILGPTAPTAAFPLGERAQDPLRMYLCDVYTVPPNLGGFPGLSVPCGFTGDGLPIGAQIVGPHWSERTLYRAGLAIESALGLSDRHPPEA